MMRCRYSYIKVLIVLAIFLFWSYPYLSAQEKEDAREVARQHYLQGKQFYSQGQYQEAANEFKEAMTIIIPSTIEFMERVQTEQEKTLAPQLPEGPASQEAMAIITPSTVQFMERVQTEQEKTLAPVPPKSAPSPEEKLAQKKKEEEEEEKKKQAEKEAGAAKPLAIEAEPAPEIIEEEPVPEVAEREYYIDLGDVLDVSVWEVPISKEKLAGQIRGEKENEKNYYIDIGDVLDISVWQVPDLSRPDVIVRPDGKISYPLIGDIKVEGISLSSLDDIITEKLKAYVKNPEVSIMVKSLPGGELGRVTMRSDLSRPDVIVRPDGKISYPLIGDIKVEGLTLTSLDSLITEKLKAYVKNPEVSIMMRHFGEQANKIIILGEIPGPGVYKFSNPPTITEVIASAGGYTRYSVLSSIMVIRGDIRTKPEVTRVNLAQIIKTGKLTQNIILKPNDIVYVPRSFIGNINTFLEIIQPAISEYMQTMNARHFQHILHRN